MGIPSWLKIRALLTPRLGAGVYELSISTQLTFGEDNGPPQAYIYRPSRLLEEVADSLVALGDPPEKIRTERFGPSG